MGTRTRPGRRKPDIELTFIGVTIDGVSWSGSLAATPDPDQPRLGTCDFCGDTGNVLTAQKGWLVCWASKDCLKAAKFHRERVEACLIDCPQTRRDTLQWVKNRGT